MRSGENLPADIKITTELLYKGALIFALMDAVYLPLLVWRVREETFRRMNWSLPIAAALVWYGIWSWAIGNFWETVYSQCARLGADAGPWIAKSEYLQTILHCLPCNLHIFILCAPIAERGANAWRSLIDRWRHKHTPIVTQARQETPDSFGIYITR